MTWGYRRRGVEREFETREELVRWLSGMDPGVLTGVRYWFIEERFEAQDVLRDLVDGLYTNVTADDWLQDALDQIEYEFTDGQYDWSEENDTIEGIYYKEEED